MTANTGVSGTSNSFTLTGTDSDYKHEFSLTNVTTSATITIGKDSTSGDNRAVIWNAEYSTGGVTTYSVTYNSNATANVDETNLPSPHTGLANNATQNLSATGPTRWGYTFGGWAATADSTTKITSVTINSANVTVYAIWNADLTVTGAHASNPYTVAQARNAIDAGTHLDENYVTGKISQIDSFNSTYKSITYWISDDGTTTNQLQAYSGKGLDNADFSTTSDITVGATVVVCGTLKKYNSTYEFDKNNYQASYTAPVIATTYDVTFVSNGGSNSPAALEVGEGLTFVFPSAGTKTNYIFKGWSSDNTTFYQEGNTSGAINADTQYTAYWQTEGTAADPYTVAEAMAAVDANTGLRGAHVTAIISQVDSFSNNAITYWISDDGTTTDQLEVYKGKGLDNADFSAASDVEVGAEVVVVGNLKLYNTTYEFDSGSYQTSYTAPAPGVYTNTSGLVAGTYYIKYESYYFTGSISNGKGSSSESKPDSTDAQFTFTLVGNDTWTIVNGASKYLTIGGTSTSLGLSNDNSTLTVEAGGSSGTYKIKGTTRYMAWYASGSDFRTYESGLIDLTLEDVNATTYTISYNANGGSGDAMSNTSGTAPVVAACAYTAPEGYMFSRWNTAQNGSGDDYQPGDIAVSDLTLYAIWIAEVGHDITMTPGTSASNVSVVTTTSKTKDAVKCGGSSAAGDMTLTLKKAGITKIKVYVAGWNNDTNKNIDVAISSGTISPTSITVTADSGVSGSGSTFTLDAAETTYKFEFTLTNAPANAEITLTANKANKNRFVVWGATNLFADTFASEFLTNLQCTANGTAQPTYTNDYSWSTFDTLYSTLDEEEQTILVSTTANQSGTDIQKAMARYDYIVGKYNKGQGITSYNDFIGRNPAAIGASRALKLVDGEAATAAAMVIVVLSAVSITAVGGFFLLKKKPF